MAQSARPAARSAARSAATTRTPQKSRSGGAHLAPTTPGKSQLSTRSARGPAVAKRPAPAAKRAAKPAPKGSTVAKLVAKPVAKADKEKAEKASKAAPEPKAAAKAAVPQSLRPSVPSTPPPAPAPVAKPSPSVPPPAPVVAAPNRPPRTSPFAIKAPPPTGAPIKLVVGDKAVHPQHGLGEVISVEEREIGGTRSAFYVLRILDKKEMRVMVPVGSPSGLRSVMSKSEAEAVLETMRAREVAVDLQPWSRRFRAYTEMIKSGLPHEVAKVLRDMYRLKFDKDLSFGERRLLDQAKSLLMKELAVAKGITEEQLLADVAQMFQS